MIGSVESKQFWMGILSGRRPGGKPLVPLDDRTRISAAEHGGFLRWAVTQFLRVRAPGQPTERTCNARIVVDCARHLAADLLGTR